MKMRRVEAPHLQNSGKKTWRTVYNIDEIVDAPEHHAYARAMGLLTWSTWDIDERPFDERVKDFQEAYPLDSPTLFQGSMLTNSPGREYAPAPTDRRLERLVSGDASFGALPEILARYGLRLRSGPDYVPREIEVAPFREVARIRNQRLRTLHGQVDIEAENMDAAKIAEIERLEKKQAAEQIRQARERMRSASKSNPE